MPPLDLARLKSGEIVVERGAVGEFSRGVHLQACYFVHAPVKAVGDALLHSDSFSPFDPDVRLYREYSLPGQASDFSSLRLDHSVRDDQWLLARSSQVAKGGGDIDDLHLMNKEASLLSQKPANEAWREILQSRSESLSKGGLTSLAPYQAGGSISPGSEFRGLITLAPKAVQHFQPVLKKGPFRPGGDAGSETVAFWEATKVRDHSTLQLGFATAQKTAESWQIASCVYYPSDTYFMSLDLYQLWPIDGGTLVWQVSFVSAPFRTYLGGADRFIAGKLMTEETTKTIKRFRAAVGKRR
ncbi:MAG: hypothetical protein ACR2G0_05885 [Chthoniobacterales bacterium]